MRMSLLQKRNSELENHVEIDGIQWDSTWSKLTIVEYNLKKLKCRKRLIPDIS